MSGAPHEGSLRSELPPAGDFWMVCRHRSQEWPGAEPFCRPDGGQIVRAWRSPGARLNSGSASRRSSPGAPAQNESPNGPDIRGGLSMRRRLPELNHRRLRPVCKALYPSWLSSKHRRCQTGKSLHERQARFVLFRSGHFVDVFPNAPIRFNAAKRVPRQVCPVTPPVLSCFRTAGQPYAAGDGVCLTSNGMLTSG